MKKRIHSKRRFLLLFWLVISSILFSNNLFAQKDLLGIYEFLGESGTENQNLAVSNKSEHADFSNFSRSENVKASPGKDFYNTRSWSTISSLDNSKYIEFTLTAKSSYKVHINKITLEHKRSPEGPKNIRIANNYSSANFDNFFYDFTTSENSSTITWDFGDITTSYGGSVTFRIYGWNAGAGTGTFRVDNVALYGSVVPPIYINEFHYAASGATKTGFVEVVVPKDFSNLASITLGLYADEDNDGLGEFYLQETLDNFKIIDINMYSEYNVYYLDIPEGLPDPVGGISLTTTAKDSIQFLSYGGSMMALDGPATGLTSADVIIFEDTDDGADNALYLPEDLPVWANYKSGTNTKGYKNGNLNIPQPVELMYFKGISTSKGVLLSWATATETHNDRFVVERSNGTETNFSPIAEIKGKGNTLQEQKYQAIDPEILAGTTYYRLKQIDFDGTFSYSNIIALNNKELATLNIFPNPVITDVRVTYENTQHTGPVLIQIYSSTGTLVYRKEYTNSNFINSINLSLNYFPAGTYLLVLINGAEKQSKKFIKM